MADNQSGFTLLEVLVAFIIASLALAVLFHTGIEGLRGATNAARTQEALARAQSRLATIGRDLPLQDSDRQGDDGGGYHWRTPHRHGRQRPAHPIRRPQRPPHHLA